VKNDGGEALSLGDDAHAAQGGGQLSARQRLSAAERAHEHCLASRDDPAIQLELPKVGGADGVNARRCQREHPPDVGRWHEVPRGPQNMRAENAPLVVRAVEHLAGESRRPKSHAPFRAAIVLGLHGPQPGHDVGGIAKRAAAEPLVSQPQVDKIAVQKTNP
jgi:hypothetical protein